MKKSYSISIMGCLLLTTINCLNVIAQNANTTLSNLTAPTAVNQNLLPKSDNGKNLGSDSKSWKDFYFDGSVYVSGIRFITAQPGTGIDNTAVGKFSLSSNTSGAYNTAFGYYSLKSNIGGSGNSAFGEAALWKNISGQSNAAFGQNALAYNTSSNANSAFGNGALYVSTGSSNSAFGEQALWNNIAGSNNSAFGQAAGHSNSTGNENTYAGKNAGFSNQHSDYNVMIGSQSGYSSTGAQNTFVGTSAGRDFTAGNYNVCLGINAGYGGAAAKTGNYNTYIGGYTNAAASIINATAIGYATYVSSSYTVRIGDGSVTSIGGYTNWSNISDGRVKKNIKQNVPGLSFINKLQAVTYNLDLEAADKIIQRPAVQDKDGKTIQPLQEEITARLNKEKIIYSGFVAQDVEKIAKELNYNFSGVDAAKTDKDLYGLRYADFVVPLVKAVQELSKMNDEKDSIIQNFKSRLEKLEAIMNVKQSAISNQTIKLSSASLEQNTPNPFNQTTTINYTLPQKYSSAQIIITDQNGRTLKQINITGNGKRTLSVNAAELASGTYKYALIVDGRITESKQMMLVK